MPVQRAPIAPYARTRPGGSLPVRVTFGPRLMQQLSPDLEALVRPWL
jgi:hypothetical protein